jgi:Ca2+-binding EF-hand superfamily protein
VVDVIFHIFDNDGDGVLSMEEFLGVLQRRERDLADPTDTGLVELFKCWWKCAGNCHKPWTL